MSRSKWEPGRVALVQYHGENLWHERYLLMKTSSSVYKEFMGSAAPKSDRLWWIVTPDGDIYIEAFVVGDDISGICLLDDSEEQMLRNSMEPAGKRLGTVYAFEAGRGPGLMTALVFARSLAGAQSSEAKARKAGGAPSPADRPGRPDPAKGKGAS